jgi:hypothetical protein
VTDETSPNNSRWASFFSIKKCNAKFSVKIDDDNTFTIESTCDGIVNYIKDNPPPAEYGIPAISLEITEKTQALFSRSTTERVIYNENLKMDNAKNILKSISSSYK